MKYSTDSWVLEQTLLSQAASLTQSHSRCPTPAVFAAGFPFCGYTDPDHHQPHLLFEALLQWHVDFCPFSSPSHLSLVEQSVCSPFLMLWQSFALRESLTLLSPCLVWGLMENSSIRCGRALQYVRVLLFRIPVCCQSWKKKCSMGFCLASLAGGAHCWPSFPGCGSAWPHQLGRGKGKVPDKVCRSLLLCVLFCVFWWGNRLYRYKKNSCVLFQTFFWCLLTTGWPQKGSLCHGLG